MRAVAVMPSSSPFAGLFLMESDICEVGEADDVFIESDELYALTIGRPGEFTYRQKRSVEQDGD